jgi:hypothetical protein
MVYGSAPHLGSASLNHLGLLYILRDVQLRIKKQPSLQTVKDEENVG